MTVSEAARIDKLKTSITEIKRLVSESGRDATFIGEVRMLLWEIESELNRLSKEAPDDPR